MSHGTLWRSIGLGTLVTFAPTVALAHPGHGLIVGGLGAGFAHPFTGLDHLLAMVAIGFLGVRLGGRWIWALPAAFVTAMVGGAALAFGGYGLPVVEVMSALSVVIVGAIIALGQGMPVTSAMALIMFFGAFHGHAHATEASLSSSVLSFGAGFVAATCLLHAVGVAIGLRSGGASRAVAGDRIAGAALAIAGAALLATVS